MIVAFVSASARSQGLLWKPSDVGEIALVRDVLVRSPGNGAALRLNETVVVRLREPG